MTRPILVFDFGGTKLAAATVLPGALASSHAAWLDQRRIHSPPESNAHYELKTMIALGRELLAGEEPLAVGVSFGGPAAFSTGLVRRSVHVPGWENVPLQAILEDHYGVPVCLENDANAGALGEFRLGAGRNAQDLLYITISTGVGGGLILNGRPWRGAQELAGEIGHQVVDSTGPYCLCGRRGCVERLASGPWMSKDAQQKLEAAPQDGRILRELSRQAPINGEILAQAAAAGDGIARSILLRGAHALGTAIGNSANLLNIPLFVLGGGVTGAGDLWWDEVRRAALATALPEVIFAVVPSALGDDAPLWGSAVLAYSLL